MPVPSGGPATISGIVYQLLWSLMQASRMRVLDVKLDSSDQDDSEASLILEPIGSGGDAVVVEAGAERVVQLKARSGGGAWSLREIVLDVLPDLYKRVQLGSNQEFAFVTEGRQGQWKEVADQFGKLRDRPLPSEVDCVPDALDDVQPINFSGTLPAIPDTPIAAVNSPITERKLFLAIADRLRAGRLSEEETTDQTHRKLWKLLASFKIEGGLTQQEIRRTLRFRLRPVVNHIENLDATIDALLMDLAQRATQGDAVIDPNQLYEHHGIRAAPLNQWNALVSRSAAQLRETLTRMGYRSDEDERLLQAREDFASWSHSANPHIVVSGESGQGKSWRLAAIARAAAENAPIVVVRTSGKARTDREEIERVFASNVWGQDQPIALERVADRLSDVLPESYGPWLYVFVDNVQSYEEASILLGLLPQRVSVAMTAPPGVAERLADRLQESLRRIDVPDFTEAEAKRYLVEGDEARWHDIPLDVRALLQRPLLAELYRGTAQRGWVPTDEYDLFNRHYSHRYLEPVREEHPDALRPMRDAALNAWEGGSYPWPLEELSARGLGGEALKFLVRIGWLQRDEDDRYRIWHDRLLAWEIATALAKHGRAGTRNFEQDAARVAEAMRNEVPKHPAGASGYVAMDLVWQLAGPGDAEPLDSLLAAFEGDYYQEELLYTRLLPTVGPRIVPALARRLVEISSPNASLTRSKIAETIAAFDVEQVTESALRLLVEPDSDVRQAAMKILKSRATPRATGPLFTLYRRLLTEAEVENPEAHAGRDAFWERIKVWPALRACARLDPDWVEAKIRAAPVGDASLGMLASFLESLHDGRERWLRLKALLREGLRPEDRRHYASNVGYWRDSEEVEWLRAGVGERGDPILGPVCLQALGRIDPALALEAIGDADPRDFAMSRKWTLAPFQAAAPELTAERMTALIREKPEARWHYADAYGSLPNALTEEALDVLLDDLAEALANKGIESVFRFTSALEHFQSPRLLSRLQNRAGTDLEKRLAERLIEHGARETLMSDTIGKPAVILLYKIGGEGFTQLINFWLSSPHKFGRWDGIDASRKRPDAETLQLLRAISLRESSEEDAAFEAVLAGAALAAAEDWQGVVEHIVAKGGAVQTDTIYARWGLGPLPNGDVDSAERALASNSEHAGAILAVGFAERDEYVERIIGVLERVEDATLITNCLWSLHLLRQLPQESLPLIASFLASAEHHDMAELILQNDRSELAYDALLEDFKARCRTTPPRSYTMGEPEDLADNGVYLLHQDRTRLEAATLLKERISSGSALNSYNASFLRRFASALDLPDVLQILDQPHVIAFLTEEAFREDGRSRMVGNKALSIRLLGAIRPQTGYTAAMRVLRNPEAHDREWMPSRVIEWDVDRAIDDLFEFACTAPLPLRTTVARAFRAAEVIEPIRQRLNSSEPTVRACACFLLGFAEPQPAVSEALKDRLGDVDEAVHVAAYKAFHRIQEAITTNELVEAFRTETDRSKKWILLDAAISVGEPGEKHVFAPTWYRLLVERENHSVRSYARKRLEKRREEVAKNIEDDARREED